VSTSRKKGTVHYASESERLFRAAMAGWPVAGNEIRVVDSRMRDVPRDCEAVGEVVVRADNVMEGYYREPEATGAAMSDGWFHTGDMAVWDEENYIHIVDRKKDIIISGGENISSLEIEKALSSHPAVYETAVIPVPDAKWGEVPKALVVLRPAASASEEDVLEFCRARMAHYKCPRSVEFLASLPKTGTGKILKKDLRKQYWGQGTIRPELAEAGRKSS
jgi:fatty-acyl-CoA synthase